MMVELTVEFIWAKWFVRNKHLNNQDVRIPCDTSEEAMNILEQLNGQPYEVIDAFHRARQKLGRP
jgi:hypothetical protein